MKPQANSLFSQTPGQEPLAARMRPRTIDDYVGQDHIMGPGRLLRRAIQADQLSSVIFSGPPGTGKTTLARVIAGSTSSDFISLNAVLSGVADIREAIDKAKSQKELHGRKTILFVDEVHRWNKSQQDALLPWVENGTFVLIGATTENPYFEVNAALVSRSRIFQLKSLSNDDLRAIAEQALRDPIRGYGNWRVSVAPDALEHLVHTATGDARSLLNALELAVETTPPAWPPEPGASILIDLSVAEESIQQRALLYDREGDYHFDSISAFIKSLRGSDPDAALYWLARMVRSGESPRFIFRRMLVSASEDIGLADPQALVMVQSAAEAFERVGLPEGQFFLSQAALYLATAPKSNSCLGYFDALKLVESEAFEGIPNHLKDSNRDGQGFGHGQGYQYPHAFRDHWVAQNYLPQGLQAKVFYQPGELGHEGKLRGQVLRRRELQLAEAPPTESVEQLSHGPESSALKHFLRRSAAQSSSWMNQLRETVFEQAAPARHERLLVLGERAAYLLPEALRRVPEGLVYALLGRIDHDNALHQLGSAGLLENCRLIEPDQEESLPALPEGPAELVVAYQLAAETPAVRPSRFQPGWCSPDCRLTGAEILPALGPRLSALVAVSTGGADDFLQRVAEAEDAFWAQQPGLDSLRMPYAALGFEISETRIASIPRQRLVDQAQLDQWFGSLRPGSWAAALRAHLGQADFEVWQALARKALDGRSLDWPLVAVLVQARLSNSSQRA